MSAKRKQISKKVRFEIFKRDGFSCQYCGSTPPKVVLHVDHIIPVARGGCNDDDNLVTSCLGCNLGKGARSLAEIPVPLATRAAEVAEREAQLRGYSEVMEKRRERLENDSWRVADIYLEGYGIGPQIHADLFRSIRLFVDKLGVHTCMDAMEFAVSKMSWNQKKGFKYFCGMCWNRVREGSL